MASLVKVTKESRLLLKVGGVLLGVVFLLYMVLKGGSIISNVFFPKPPPPPKQELGKLPQIEFPQVQGSNESLEYTINTVNGQLPILPDRVDVYKLITPEPNLLALENAKNTIDSKNFVENQTKIDDTTYRWTQSRTGIIIEYEIVTKNFTIKSDFLTNPFLASSNVLPSEDMIIADTMAYLQTIRANVENIEREKSKIEYLQIENGQLITAENLGSARFARITFQQQPLGEIPIIYDAPGNSLLTFIVSYPGTGFQIVDGQFYNHVPDLEAKSDYPIKTAAQALEDLKAGNAYIINPLNLTRIDITNVELKYYQSKKNQGFLLPIIVFTGINFTGYVEAIPSSSLTN